MNVALPGEDNPRMFLLALLISLFIASAVALWFYRRGWMSSRWRRADKRKAANEHSDV
jgi:hypothetical protein